MPQRTNRKQQIIEMLRAMLAPQEVVIIASKMLMDRQLGIEREVDVVAESLQDGKPFVQSFEVTGKSRPMDLFWVDGMLRKHETLSTDKLYLVSWSGFSKDARRRALLTPNVVPVTVGDVAGAASLFADQANLKLVRVTPAVLRPDGAIASIPVPNDTAVYTSAGELRGTLWQLGSWIIQHPIPGLLEMAHDHPQRDEVTWFELKQPLVDDTFGETFLYSDGNELHRVVAVTLHGQFEFRQDQVPLTLKAFEASVFGHGATTLGGKPHLIVASLDATHEVTKVIVEVDKTMPPSTDQGKS